MNVVETVLGLVYPRNCAVCSTPLPEGSRDWLCGPHLGAVKLIRPPCCRRCGAPFAGELTAPPTCARCAEMRLHFEMGICAVELAGVAQECVHNFKYRKQLWLDQHLAAWLGDAAAPRVPWAAVDLIVPVPLFPRREREREFNQAEWIAAPLARRFGKPLAARALRRVRDTLSQTTLDREERAKNVRGAFVVRDADAVRGRGIALVDDVLTTGATTSECARELKKGGARRVFVLAVARG